MTSPLAKVALGLLLCAAGSVSARAERTASFPQGAVKAQTVDGRHLFFRDLHTRLVPFEGRHLVALQREVQSKDGIRRFVVVPGFYKGTSRTAEGMVTDAVELSNLAQMRRAKDVVAAQPGLKGRVVVHNEP